MKVGIVSRAFDRFGEARYEKMKELGFSAVDFSMANTKDSLYLCSDEDFCRQLRLEKKHAHKYGIEFTQIHGPWRVPIKDFTEEDRAERMEKMKKAVRAAAILGAGAMVIHPIMPFGIFDVEKQKTKETWVLNLTFMRELAAYGAEHGVTVCLENMPFATFSISKPEQILQMIDAVENEYFKMCLDMGHVNVFPELSLVDELKRCQGVIRALHVHDNNGKSDNHALPYFGTVDWETVGETLANMDLPCPFSYETAPPARLPLPIYETYLKSMVDIAREITKA